MPFLDIDILEKKTFSKIFLKLAHELLLIHLGVHRGSQRAGRGRAGLHQVEGPHTGGDEQNKNLSYRSCFFTPQRLEFEKTRN